MVKLIILFITRTTRQPAFWGYPLPAPWLPIQLIYKLDPKSKQIKVTVTDLKNLPKFHIFEFQKKTLHPRHLLKLLHKMCKYEMDPASIVEDTERTQMLILMILEVKCFPFDSGSLNYFLCVLFCYVGSWFSYARSILWSFVSSMSATTKALISV